jgi:molybdopterin synthase sulfur carrier subunit
VKGRNSVRVTVRLFAHMRVAAGVSELALTLPEACPLEAALEILYKDHPELREHGKSCLTAVGLDYAIPERVLHEGEEICLIPPVQGG